jgi:hypothetical protein
MRWTFDGEATATDFAPNQKPKINIEILTKSAGTGRPVANRYMIVQTTTRVTRDCTMILSRRSCQNVAM